MKKVLYFSLLLLICGTDATAAKVHKSIPQTEDVHKTVKAKVTRGNVQIIEATENIRYVSQRLAKEYLFFYLNPENEKTHKDLYASLEILGKNLRAISMVTKDEDTQDILEFLAYSKEEISALLAKKPAKDTVALMLDYSETLLEGADSIGKTYAYDFSQEEKMLVSSKNIKFLLERIGKYYMALKLGYDTENNKENMQSSIEALKKHFARFDAYPYPEKLKETENLLANLLASNIRVVTHEEQYFIPSLLLDSISFFEEKADVLALYHSKNL